MAPDAAAYTEVLRTVGLGPAPTARKSGATSERNDGGGKGAGGIGDDVDDAVTCARDKAAVPSPSAQGRVRVGGSNGSRGGPCVTEQDLVLPEPLREEGPTGDQQASAVADVLR